MRSGKHNEYWRINERIQARELRVIGPDGKQVGILSREEALARTREEELDLVEIAPHANPPVAKIIDYTKFKYEQDKKSREERKKEKKGAVIKEIRFTPLIAEGDYQTRLEHVREFITEGTKVRITIRPKRRLDNNSPLYRVLERILADLAEEARTEQEPRLLGKQLTTLLAPFKGQKKDEEENGQKDEKQAT